MSTREFIPDAEVNRQLHLVQLDSTGMWSVRNLDGDRVGYFPFRCEAIEWLDNLGYARTEGNAIGSTWALP